jgi:Uma2 family endonuclease
MAMYIENSEVEEELIARRQAWGVDQHDEVWEGVYFMPPMANNEHQRLVLRFTRVLDSVVAPALLGEAFPGVNLAASAEDWEHDYRVPDVVIFLADTTAQDHDAFWTGAADFIIEITSPRDRTYEKMSFYSRIGVREVLIFNRQSRTLEFYKHQDSSLPKVGESTPDRPDVLSSEKPPLEFWLTPGEPRPRVEVRHKTTGQRWTI